MNKKHYHKEYNLARYHRLRKEYLQLVGDSCVDCGATEQLEFDHVDRTTKVFDIGKQLTYPRERILEELKKCVLRCKTCHKLKSDAEQSVEHGKGLTGKKNCNCDLCGPLKREYNRNYKQRKNK